MRFGLLMANQHPPADPPLQRFAETVTQVGLAPASRGCACGPPIVMSNARRLGRRSGC
jgi:hypothetical protein